MEIVFVTSNQGKLNTAQAKLSNLVNLSILKLDIEEPRINDIEFIALYKVKEAYKKVKKPCISLDAGFYITNFPNKPNFPGAFPKRDLLQTMGINGLLDKMKTVDNRYCYFRECLAYYDGKNYKLFYGETKGQLATEVRGSVGEEKWSDLWYVFIPEGCDKTMAEMSKEERAKNVIKTDAFDEFAKYILYNENELVW